ncbi:MAG: TIGR00341 family protein [Brevundimonas sp.]|uniref:TIGR00341 family protein n=1 Tax=Brevundimonas sp. TaxID=1871086 RepID=UPI00391BE76B
MNDSPRRNRPLTAAGLVLRHLVREGRRGVDHASVSAHVYGEGALSGRYMVMTIISAGIAVLGLMLSSPAVVIGAMLVSPLMGPIIALGFSLALLDWDEMKRAIKALAIGLGAALLVAFILTLLSPLKEPTSEILARTRPNFFDLLVAVFSGVAGGYAVIRARGETIIGVAIATALMPPIATVGFGLATGSLIIAGGAFFLFMTNLLAIAFAATLTASFYGFRPHYRERPRPWRALGVISVFLVLSVPLIFSLASIGLESRAAGETRRTLDALFADAGGQLNSLDVRADGRALSVRALISTRQVIPDAEASLAERLGRLTSDSVEVRLDQLVVSDPGAVRAAQIAQSLLRQRLVDAVPFATEFVTFSPDDRLAVVRLRADAGLDLAASRALERALAERFPDLTVRLIPPLRPPGTLALSDAATLSDTLWALQRWQARIALRHCPSGSEGELSDEALRERIGQAGIVISATEAPPCPSAGVAVLALD